MRHTHLAAMAAALVIAILAPARAADPLAQALWKSRVLLVSAATRDDHRLDAQRRVFAAMGQAARERDLILVEVVGDAPHAAALRKRFDIPLGAFTALLIGKDGGEKLRSDRPLGPDQLFPLIDAMPMRQDEMARRP